MGGKSVLEVLIVIVLKFFYFGLAICPTRARWPFVLGAALPQRILHDRDSRRHPARRPQRLDRLRLHPQRLASEPSDRVKLLSVALDPLGGGIRDHVVFTSELQ